jgi:hypothetical protein
MVDRAILGFIQNGTGGCDPYGFEPNTPVLMQVKTTRSMSTNKRTKRYTLNVKKWIAASIIVSAIAAQTHVAADDGVQPTQTTRDTQVTTDTTTVTVTNQVTTTKWGKAHDEPFPSNQLSLQAFGTYATRDREGARADMGGGGLGLTYFFTRYVGIGADTYIEEWKWPYRVNGSVILRLPLPEQLSKLAVYGFGGGGREFKDIPQFTWHGGGGLEYKFCRYFGLFADAREVFPDKTASYTLARAGVDFGF